MRGKNETEERVYPAHESERERERGENNKIYTNKVSKCKWVGGEKERERHRVGKISQSRCQTGTCRIEIQPVERKMTNRQAVQQVKKRNTSEMRGEQQEEEEEERKRQVTQENFSTFHVSSITILPALSLSSSLSISTSPPIHVQATGTDDEKSEKESQ